ncbi:hypothetical protein HELRODRAFT_188273 [Helobdella robusta]|uniref:MSP domain-containing protein n=1 Tax=Helobdella robusta TaxID=6412 RepID=T1FPT7_HELRO|nr:hypothetical protein HELRODRAFT_188273 [Helobdella robusta]ESO06141.1 hypothetical protein HELRODRAFT_188273 [Helobdella robusta]
MVPIKIEPQEDLVFEGPFNEVVNSSIIITNPSDRIAGFKVKTTAPKQYCVRPNCGFVNPGQSVNITVMLQPFNYNPNDKLKHKFLIQSILVNEANLESPELVEKWQIQAHLGRSVAKGYEGLKTELAQNREDSNGRLNELDHATRPPRSFHQRTLKRTLSPRWKEVKQEDIIEHKLKCVFEERGTGSATMFADRKDGRQNKGNVFAQFFNARQGQGSYMYALVIVCLSIVIGIICGKYVF